MPENPKIAPWRMTRRECWLLALRVALALGAILLLMGIAVFW